MRLKKLLLGLLVVAVALVGFIPAQAKLVPKIDHFVLFVDQSGSMYMTHKVMKDLKIRLVKKVLSDMNELIPELGYHGSIQLFAPLQQVLGPQEYKRSAFAQAIGTIREDQKIYGRLTPMGPGILGLDPLLAQMTGRKAVIIFSDGEANKGSDPVMESQALSKKYPNLCFHVVSFAETSKGKAILEKISKIGSCIMVDGVTLLNDKEALAKFVKDVFYEEVPEERIVLRGIHFDFDKYNIKPEWIPVLDEGVAVLQKHPEVKIIIEGHTDSIGTEAYNQKLSERRAKAVFDYFVSKGISPDRMKTVGFGELRPKADNSTAEGRAINRRVEIKIVK